MKITTLMDNVVFRRSLRAEHGFSALIDTGEAGILFDTGQTGGILSNAEAMDVDLSSVEAVVLSHGHYDHAGGLAAFCRINSRARIYCKPACMERKYVGERYIGMPEGIGDLKERIVFIEKDMELVPGVAIVTDIPVRNEWDTHFKNFVILGREGQTPDRFEDELFLTLTVPDGIAVLSGCSHRGITNIAAAARDKFQKRIRLVLGGFHVKDEGPAAIGRMTDELNRLGVERIGVCHCTGVDGYAVMKGLSPENTFYNPAGNVVEF